MIPMRIDQNPVFVACWCFWHLLQPYFLRTPFVVALRLRFRIAESDKSPFLRFSQIDLLRRIFYLSHLFEYQHVFRAPILSPQLSGRLTFGKITSDFPTPVFVRICEVPMRIDPTIAFVACWSFWHLLQAYFLRPPFVVALLPGFSRTAGR